MKFLHSQINRIIFQEKFIKLKIVYGAGLEALKKELGDNPKKFLDSVDEAEEYKNDKDFLLEAVK